MVAARRRFSIGVRRAGLQLVGSLLIVIASTIAPGFATEAPSPSDDLYRRAASQEGVPLELLVAVAGAESGYHPWALNVDGQQIYCHSRAEAERLLAQHDRVAIGLMQINWQFWGPKIGLTKEGLLDPSTNLMIGARILKEGLRREADIWYGISNYHSGSAHRRDKYNQLVYQNYLRYLRGDIK